MKPAILLIGANGQVGRELLGMLPRIGDVTALDRSQLDLSKPEEIRNVIRAVRPQWIVNAAAYTAVDKAESETSLARAINSEAPGVMAEEAKELGAILIHYSTDYVFDGLKTTPYEEDDATDPQNVYGKTKLEGEQAIQASGAAHLIFRTAWVYATTGKNFLLTILRLATQREELRIVSDQIGAPILSGEIARATMEIVSKLSARTDLREALTETSGIYHLTAAGETSWAGFAEAILEEAASIAPDTPWFAQATNRMPLMASRVVPIRTSEFPTPARRPAYSVLSNARLARAFGVRVPDWRSQLRSAFTAPSR
jgi:dTDP-4-dehydrorhamnose reductase